MSRRTTLGSLSQGALNSRESRASLGGSLGAARVSNTKIDAAATVKTTAGPTARPSLSRRSSVGPAAAGVTRKSSVQTTARGSLLSGRADPRNITDKRFIHSSIRALIDYLTMHNYDNSISPKILTNPSTKDFNNIVQFLFRQVDPNFAYTGKYEDEVISMFKCLKYPYSISKTALNAVGSPHSWPQLLASVMWIIELLAYDEACNSEAAAASEGDLDENEKFFLRYLHNAYRCFLGGDDAMYGQLEEEFVDVFESKNKAAADDIKVFEMKNDALSREIEELGERMAYLPELQEKKKVYLKDLGKFQNLILELNKYKKELEAKTSMRKADLDRTTSSLANVEREVDELKQRIATQELSPEDVRRLSEERAHIESALSAAQTSRISLESKVHDAEKLLRSKVLDLEEVMRAYTSLGEDLQLLPAHARNAQGQNLELDIDTRAKKRSDLIRCDIRGGILPLLKTLRGDLSDVTNGIRDQSALVLEEMEEVDTEIAEQEDRARSLENRLQRAEELYRREKEFHENALVSHTAEATELEERLLRCRDIAAEEAAIALSSRRIADARAKKAFLKDEHYRKRKELLDGIMDVITRCADHRELIERRQGEIRELYSQRLEALLAKDFFPSPSFAKADLPLSPDAQVIALSGAVNNKVLHKVEQGMATGYVLRSQNTTPNQSKIYTKHHSDQSSKGRGGDNSKQLFSQDDSIYEGEQVCGVVMNLSAQISDAAAKN